MLALALEFLDKLLESLFLDEIKQKITDYLDRRNVERTISRCSEAPAQALESYFHNEGIDKEKVKIILEELQHAITSAKVDAKMLASASLNSEKLVETILSKYPIPEKIQEKRLEWPFQMALQISADALCNIGPRFNEWDREAWRRNFEAFDKLLQNQEAILQAVGPGGEGSLDKRFEHTYRSHILRRLAQIDASTLRVSSSFFLDLTTVFVQPEVIRVPKSKKKSKSLEKVADRIVSLEEARQQLLSRPESGGQSRRIYAEKFVAKHRRCAIVGLPGTGKTTLLQHILVESAKSEISFNGTNVIPVLVRARDLDMEHLPGPDDLLQVTEGKVLAGACPAGFLTRQFNKGKVLLLIDGLDEIVADKRDNLMGWISDFIELFPKCRYIISSRPAGYQSHAFQKLRFNEVTLCEFNSDQIREYVRRWTKAVEIAEGVPFEEAEQASSKSAQALVERAERNPYVQRIATNPLMLSTLCLVQRYEGGDLPNRRVVLYQRCVEGLLFYWDNKRGLPPAMLGSLQLEHKMLLLRRLALEMQIQGVAEIKEGQIKKSFSNSLIELGQRPNTEAILDNIRDRSGLLIERRPRIYGFSHLTFQEYMGALSINQGDYNEYDRLFLFSKRSDPQWSEVIALYAGTAPRGAVESLLKELVKTGNTESILLAGECLASAQNVGLSTQKSVISRLLYLEEDESLPRPIKHLAVNGILLSLNEHIVIEEAARALYKTVSIHAIRFFYFKRSPKSINALFQLGKRVILGTQPTWKYDYGVSLILLIIEHSDAAKALANLAILASKQTGLDERRNVLCGLFSMELFQRNLPSMERIETLPGVFAFLDKPNATKEQIDICKFIEVASSLGIDRNFMKEHGDLWRRFTPSNIILEKLKHLSKSGPPSVRDQASRAARRFSSIIAELDKKLAKPRKK